MMAEISATGGRVWQGLYSSALAQAITTAQNVLLVPLFLAAWGSEGYGRWLTLTALASYLGLLELGGQSYIGNLLAADHVRDDLEGFQKKLSEGVSCFSCLGLGGFVVVVLVLALGGRLPILGVDGFASGERWAFLLLAAVALLIAVPTGLLATAYRAAGLFARGVMLTNIVRLFGLGAMTLLLVLGVKPVTFAGGLLVIGVIGTTVIALDLRRRVLACRGLDLNLAEAWRGRVYLTGAIHFWFVALAQVIKQQGVLLVLAAVVSPVAVAAYATHRMASGLVGYVASLIQGPIWPELSFLAASGRSAELARATLLTVRAVVVSSGIAAMLVATAVPPLYLLWTGRRLEFQPLLLCLFLLQALLAAGWSTAGWSLLASNHHRPLAMWSLANAVVTIAAAVALVGLFGVVGVAGATLLGDVVCGLAVFPRLAAGQLGISPWRMYGAMLTAGVALVPLALVMFLAGIFLDRGWAGTVSLLAVMVLAYPTLRAALGRAWASRAGELAIAWTRRPA